MRLPWPSHFIGYAFFYSLTVCDYVWPDAKIDVMESLLYEQALPMAASSIPSFVKNCSGFGSNGRNFAAEWLRNAYHDMATADVAAGIGGMDASIVFETNRPENVGAAFNETMNILSFLQTTRSTMADVFALAAVVAIQACSNGTINVPLRAGRIDATGPGPSGVPQPQEGLMTHTATFARAGFNVTEMIGLVACGHTIGGVHGVDFPTIVPDPDTGTDNTVTFDSTTNSFDNTVAVEFVANISQDPLAFGTNTTTNSDARVFKADGGSLIEAMASSNDFFVATCTTLFERMLNTVPNDVILSDIIHPIPVKPSSLVINVNQNGTMTVSGIVRVLNDILPSSTSEVLIKFVPRSGSPCSATRSCQVVNGITNSNMAGGSMYPSIGPEFTFYSFEAMIPTSEGVSSFTVEILDNSTGSSVLHDNGGNGFPLSDILLPQPANSSSGIGTPSSEGLHVVQLNLTVAVLNDEKFTNVSLIIAYPNDINDPIFNYDFETIPMAPSQTIEGTNYTLWTATYTSKPLKSGGTNPYDIVATGAGITIESTYNSWGLVPEGTVST